MLFASYIPTDPSINRAQFSSDNFNFCIQSLIDSSIQTEMSPVMGLFQNQISVAETTQQSINTVRYSAASDITNPFNGMMVFAWNKFNLILEQVLRVVFKVNTAFQRIGAIIISSLFAAISLYTGIDNLINFIFVVIIIILTIIIAMIIVLFFILAPIMAAIIIPVLAVIGGTVYASQAGGMEKGLSPTNCVKSGTLVKGKDGWKKVDDIQLGDSLWDGTVEGILFGKGSPSVFIHSVQISNLHIVFDSSVDRWVFAKDHTDAIPCETPLRVYSLLMSNRIWTVYGDKEVLLRDWSHAKEGDEEIIQRKVCSLLGSPYIDTRGLGLVGPHSVVWKAGYGPCQISLLKVGDRIKDDTGLTEVISIYHSTEVGNSSGPNDSVWTLESAGWRQHSVVKKGEQVRLMHCGTASGKFLMNGRIIRDFNEIDHGQVHTLEEFLLSLL
jgi:hypothetical protein